MGHTLLGQSTLDQPPVGAEGHYDIRLGPETHEEPINEWPAFTPPPPEDPTTIALPQRFIQESERSQAEAASSYHSGAESTSSNL